MVDRNWNGRINAGEIRRSNLLQTLVQLEEEPDINQVKRWEGQGEGQGEGQWVGGGVLQTLVQLAHGSPGEGISGLCISKCQPYIQHGF